MRIPTLTIFFLLSAGAVFAQSNRFETGTVIDTVWCQANPGQSYALYLPSTYTPKRLWPIIYAFDPVARGALPVKLMKSIAEKYGYIVVGSNNSRNGPLKPQFDAANALSIDTQQRFSINQFRLYTMGFSGGARLASTIAVQTGKIAGVIACGASFIRDDAPKPNAPFAYAAVIGNTDMNYSEMRHYSKILDELDYPNRLFIFEGGHRWPPEEILMKVATWLELHAMLNNSRLPNQAWIDSLFATRLAEAQNLKNKGRFFEAYEAYSQIAADFKTRHDLDAVRDEIEWLEDKDEVEKSRKEAEKIQRKELVYLNKLLKRINSIKPETVTDTGDFDDKDWWRDEIRDLKKKREESDSAREKMMYERILAWLRAKCVEESGFALQQNDPESARVYLEIWGFVQSKNPFRSYNLARTFALAGKTDRALDALSEAVSLGFWNVQRVENDSLLVVLHSEPGYKRLISALKLEGSMINR